MKAWKAEFLLIAMTLIWGATFTFTKQGLDDTTPFLYIILRFVLALALSVLAFKKSFRLIDKKMAMQGIILGLFFGAGFLLQTLGLKLTEASKSGFITGITVVITPFVFSLIEKKKVKFWSKVGVVIATPGLWVFSNPDINNINVGDVLTLISTLFWAFYIVYMDIFTKDRNQKGESGAMVILQYVGALPLAVLAFLIFELPNGIYLNPTYNLLTSVLFNGIMASFVVTIIHTSVQKYSSPVKAALIFSLEPVFAAIFAFSILGEIMTGIEYIGAAILLSGVVVSEIGGFFSKKNVNA